MIEYLTPHSAATEVRMLREDPSYQGAIVLVEGATDARLFGGLLTADGVTVRWMDGKENVLAQLRILEDERTHGILAIVDADFWHMEGIPPGLGPNVMISDSHDVDLMLFESPAAPKVMAEYYFDAARLGRLSQEFPKLRKLILGAARKVGMLRWISHTENLGLSFRAKPGELTPIDLTPAIDISACTLSMDKLLRMVCPTNAKLRELLSSKAEPREIRRHNPLHLCNGHDVMQILCILIRRQGRAELRPNVDPALLELAFRLAYELRFFQVTELHRRITTWEKETGYKVL